MGTRLFIISILSFLIFGCVEQIDLEIPRTSGQLVVFGNINTSDLRQRVQILRTSGIENQINPVFGADVKLIGESGAEGCFVASANGVYKFDVGSIEVLPGRTYYLEIRLITGEVYRSIPTVVPVIEAIAIGDRSYTTKIELSDQQVDVPKNFIQISGATTVNRTDNPFYLRWEVEETFRLNPTDFPDPFNVIPDPCYIIQDVDPQRIAIFNGENYNSNTIGERIFAEKEIDYSFQQKHFFTTITHSINEDAYNFWNQVNQVTNSTGSIFDAPPAGIRGNVFNVEDEDEIVLGFFELSNAQFSRFNIFSNDVPFPVPPTGCQFDPNMSRGQYPGYCLSCTFFEDGSTTRPPYF